MNIIVSNVSVLVKHVQMALHALRVLWNLMVYNANMTVVFVMVVFAILRQGDVRIFAIQMNISNRMA